MRTADSAAWGPGGHGQLSGAAGMLAQGLGQGGGHPPVAGHIQHVQLGCVGKLGWQNGQAVVPQGEDAECCAPSDLGRQHLQVVPVHVEVGQLGEPPKGAGQGLHRGGREGGRVKASERWLKVWGGRWQPLGQSCSPLPVPPPHFMGRLPRQMPNSQKDVAHPCSARSIVPRSPRADSEPTPRAGPPPTVSRFSVRISSDRFSQSPMASVTSHRRFWSAFRMDSCFS